MIQDSFKRTFKESHFQQFLTTAPGLFLHKWEMRKGRLQLLIEIPSDAAEHPDNEHLAQEKKNNEMEAYI